MNPSPLLAFNVGAPEVIVILVVFVLLFGAKKLPELSRAVGKSLGEFKKGREEAERELNAIKEDKDPPKTT